MVGGGGGAGVIKVSGRGAVTTDAGCSVLLGQQKLYPWYRDERHIALEHPPTCTSLGYVPLGHLYCSHGGITANRVRTLANTAPSPDPK